MAQRLYDKALYRFKTLKGKSQEMGQILKWPIDSQSLNKINKFELKVWMKFKKPLKRSSLFREVKVKYFSAR